MEMPELNKDLFHGTDDYAQPSGFISEDLQPQKRENKSKAIMNLAGL